MSKELTEKKFLKDVSKHHIKILRDEGVNRHIRFKAPDTSDMYFDLITWEGGLTYTGDMGTYVFQRLPDMFNFFRTKPENHKGLHINTGYWGEKCVSTDRHNGIEEYSEDKTRLLIDTWVSDTVNDHPNTEDDFEQCLKDAVQSDIYDVAEMEFEFSVRRTVDDFEFEWEGHTYQIHDFWEYDLNEYSKRFVWCCYALAWGIQQYDNYTEVWVKQ